MVRTAFETPKPFFWVLVRAYHNVSCVVLLMEWNFIRRQNVVCFVLALSLAPSLPVSRSLTLSDTADRLWKEKQWSKERRPLQRLRLLQRRAPSRRVCLQGSWWRWEAFLTRLHRWQKTWRGRRGLRCGCGDGSDSFFIFEACSLFACCFVALVAAGGLDFGDELLRLTYVNKNRQKDNVSGRSFHFYTKYRSNKMINKMRQIVICLNK